MILIAKDVLLHLVSVDTLSNRLVTFTVVTIVTSLNGALLLSLSCSSECGAKNVLGFD